MVTPEQSAVTLLLHAAKDGDEKAKQDLYREVYAELRRLAAIQVSKERGNTWEPTMLVHEAFLRMVDPEQLETGDRDHFFNTAVLVMRHVLVDHARKRDAAKRGGGKVDHVSLRESLDGSGDRDAEARLDVLALDEALTELAQLDERKAKVVELRFFGGLNVDETATALQVSRRTVQSDWLFARAWLKRRLEEH